MSDQTNLCMCRWRLGERLRDKMNAIEDDGIDRALEMTKGNMSAAARFLCMPVRTLRHILDERKGLVRYKKKRSRIYARPQ